MQQAVHRIWDFRGDQAGIIWFLKNADGSVQILHGYVNAGVTLDHYARVVHARAAGPGIDYVRPDTKCRNWNGDISLFEAMQARGLNPEVLPALAWLAPRPFAEAA